MPSPVQQLKARHAEVQARLYELRHVTHETFDDAHHRRAIANAKAAELTGDTGALARAMKHREEASTRAEKQRASREAIAHDITALEDEADALVLALEEAELALQQRRQQAARTRFDTLAGVYAEHIQAALNLLPQIVAVGVHAFSFESGPLMEKHARAFSVPLFEATTDPMSGRLVSLPTARPGDHLAERERAIVAAELEAIE